MNDKNKIEEPETWRTLNLKKYISPEEVALKNKNKKLKRALVISVIVAVGFGWIGGSMLPVHNLGWLHLPGSAALDTAKIESALEIMNNEWFFGKDVENLDERLVDQALLGITTNEEDPHTTYMSAQEMQDFTQSINRDYVGIGVQFLNTDNRAIIEKVFKDSPAEKAGVKAGDVIVSVDGTDITGMTSDEIKSLVQGDEGTLVTMTFLRGDKSVTYKITREAVSATAFGKTIDDVGYLQIYQFGDGTPREVKGYLDDFVEQNLHQLVIDLRDNGGGYLTSVQDIAGDFLKKDSLVMKQEYKDGEQSEVRTKHQPYEAFSQIVILVNENTASAAEVLTLALREQLDSVQVIGTTTYGKGSVQISRQFSDDSAIKFTTSKWLSPNGTWVNNVGIQPDKEVKMDEVMYHKFTSMEDGETFSYDQVSDAIEDMQLCLSYLGYTPDRKDGYFSQGTVDALNAFAIDNGFAADGVLTNELLTALRSAVVLEANTNEQHDAQLQAALEVFRG